MSARDKVIIVTGAARNIGFHTAASLVQRGAKVAIMGRNQVSLADAVTKLGSDTFGVCTDLSTADAIEQALEEVAAHFGGIDGIVNNAGVGYPNRVEALNDAQVVEQITVNLLAPIRSCRAVIPYLRKRGGGRIVNISSASVHVDDAFAHLSIYAATKAGLERFTKELRFETQRDNIAVTTFIPGDTYTSLGTAWEPSLVQEAYADWFLQGPYWSGTMPVEAVGEEIAHCFDLPLGVAYEFALLRPVGRAHKALIE